MSALSHPYLLGGGTVLLLVGLWLWRWASRHDLNLKGLAVDAAWQVAKNKGKLASLSESDIANRIKDVQSEGTHAGKARKAAGFAARHFVAQVASLAGLFGMLAGAILIGLAFYLK